MNEIIDNEQKLPDRWVFNNLPVHNSRCLGCSGTNCAPFTYDISLFRLKELLKATLDSPMNCLWLLVTFLHFYNGFLDFNGQVTVHFFHGSVMEVMRRVRKEVESKRIHVSSSHTVHIRKNRTSDKP